MFWMEGYGKSEPAGSRIFSADPDCHPPVIIFRFLAEFRAESLTCPPSRPPPTDCNWSRLLPPAVDHLHLRQEHHVHIERRSVSNSGLSELRSQCCTNWAIGIYHRNHVSIFQLPQKKTVRHVISRRSNHLYHTPCYRYSPADIDQAPTIIFRSWHPWLGGSSFSGISIFSPDMTIFSPDA